MRPLNPKAVKGTKLWAFLTFRWPRPTKLMVIMASVLGWGLTIVFMVGIIRSYSSFWWAIYAVAVYFFVYMWVNLFRGENHEEKPGP
jgi:hypothetical protein